MIGQSQPASVRGTANRAMDHVERIAVLENEIEAMMLGAELDALNIPHAMISYYSSAFDGLFRVFQGWGHVEAPPEFRDEILTVLENLRLTQCHDEHRDEDDDSGREGQEP